MGKSKIGCSKHFLILVLIVLAIIHFLIPPNYYKYEGRSGVRASDCKNATIEIIKAVEMYNTDSKVLIVELDEDNINILKRDGYIKDNWPYNKDNKCEYINQGDLSKDGFIYCKYHGTPNYALEKEKGNKNTAPPSKEYLDFLKAEKARERREYISKYGILDGLILFVLLLIIF